MKKTLSKLVETVKTNKRTCIGATLCVLVLLVSLAACCYNIKTEAPAADPTSTPSTVALTTEDTGQGTTTATTTVPVASSTKVEEQGATSSATTTPSTTAKEEVTPDTTTAAPTTVQTTKTTISTNKTTIQTSKSTTGTKKETTTTTAAKVVQVADPDTGISWDGKTPIVYTYEDGSSGTEPKEGATYEYRPGVISVVAPDLSDVIDDGLCGHCGKKKGNGENGTCNRFYFDDVNCPQCGAHIDAGCHTCKN